MVGEERQGRKARRRSLEEGSHFVSSPSGVNLGDRQLHIRTTPLFVPAFRKDEPSAGHSKQMSFVSNSMTISAIPGLSITRTTDCPAAQRA